MSTIYMISLLSILGTMFYYTPIEGTEFQLFDTLKSVKGGLMELECNVTDAENLNTIVQFVRNSSRLSTVCSCEQRYDHCSCDNTEYRDYICRCGRNTNITNSETKYYAITKNSTDDEDMGVWRCGSEYLGLSEPAVLLPRSGTRVTLVEEAQRVKGKMMTLLCVVTEAENLNTKIEFVRNSIRLSTVCSCVQRGDNCSCDNTRHTDYRCRCGPNTNITNSETKLYAIRKSRTDNEDMGVWRCGSEDLGMSEPTLMLPNSESDAATITSTTLALMIACCAVSVFEAYKYFQ